MGGRFQRMSRLLKNVRLLKFPSSFAVQRTSKYASRLRISGALHPDIPYPVRDKLLNSLLGRSRFDQRIEKPDLLGPPFTFRGLQNQRYAVETGVVHDQTERLQP